VYFGPVDNGFHAPPSDVWANTGNLMAATDNRFDCNQLGSPNYYDNYETALSLAGGKQVMHLFLVIDSGWLFLGSKLTSRGLLYRFPGALFHCIPSPRSMGSFTVCPSAR